MPIWRTHVQGYKVGFAFLEDILLYFLQLNPCIKQHTTSP